MRNIAKKTLILLLTLSMVLVGVLPAFAAEEGIPKVTVTFNSNGGSEIAPQTVDAGTAATKPESPVFNHKIFLYWYLDDPATEYDFNTPVNQNITLNAKWKDKFIYRKEFDNKSTSNLSWNDDINKLKDVLADEKDKDYQGVNNCWTAYMSAQDLLYTDAIKGHEAELPNTTRKLAFDIKLDKVISSDEARQDVLSETHVHHTSQPMSIRLDLNNTSQTGGFLWDIKSFRIHDGAVTELKTNFTLGSNVADIENDSFSTILVDYNWGYTVRFETNGGSAVAPQTIIEGGKAIKPDQPIKLNCDFVDWYEDEALTKVYNFDQPVTKDTVIYAKWNINNICTVNFDTHGGSAVAAQKVEKGHTATEPAVPTYTGKVFMGWFTDEACTQAFNFGTPVVTDITLHAKWQSKAEEEHTVTFFTDGGIPVPKDQTVLHNAKATRPMNNPVKTGHTFIGWFNGDIIFDFNTPITDDLLLTAKYEPIITYFTVEFNPNGGKNAPETQIVKKGDRVIKPSKNPARDGYSFVSWQLNGSDYDFNKPVEKDIVLSANWKANPVYHTIKFDSNGGNKTPKEQKVIHDGKVKKPSDEDEPEKDGGYYFDYWEKDGKEYDFDSKVTGDFTLKAKWKENKWNPSNNNNSTGLKYFNTSAITNLGTKYLLAGSSVIGITDTIKHSGYCEPGKTYTLVGAVFNKNTNQILTDAKGMPVTQSMQFTGATTGELQMTFIFDPSNIPAGTTLVVTEVIQDSNGQIIAQHNDLNNYEQSISVMGYQKVQTGLFPKLGKRLF